jgi:hypothetical protein
MARDRAFERICDRSAGHTLSHLQDRTPATPLIDDRQHAKCSTVHRRVMDEIHAPSLVRPARGRRHTAMQARVLATAHAMAKR